MLHKLRFHQSTMNHERGHSPLPKAIGGQQIRRFCDVGMPEVDGYRRICHIRVLPLEKGERFLRLT